jgi:hypothetical protein
LYRNQIAVLGLWVDLWIVGFELELFRQLNCAQQKTARTDMTIVTQHCAQVARGQPPAFVFLAVWTSEDSETKAESWIVLPEVSSAGRHSYRRFFNAQQLVQEQEFSQLARRAAELDLWRVIELNDPAGRITQLAMEELAPNDAKAWRCLSEYPGLAMIARTTRCRDLSRVIHNIRSYPELFVDSTEYPQ